MSVFANGRSILHKGHGQTQMAIAPDVCKTPSPGGPVPIPYPNMSRDSNLTKGVATVKIKGNPVANTESKLSRSNGDEAGTAGGIVSSKNMGAFGWPAGSIDVLADGKGVVRLLDSSLTNGNSYNTPGVDTGETGLAYGDDARCPRDDCKLGHDLEKHRVPETEDIGKACAEFSAEVSKNLKKKIRGAGRMIGVGICECGKVYKAMSGGPLPPTNPFVKSSGMLNAIGPLAQDAFMTAAREGAPTWSCAALKIISNAAGHKIIALSEKWLGNAGDDGSPIPKTFEQKLYNVMTSTGLAVSIPLPHDKIPNWSELGQADPVPSGGSVPSCGTCQSFLPAMICEMKPCG